MKRPYRSSALLGLLCLCVGAGCAPSSEDRDSVESGESEEELITGPYEERVSDQLERASQPHSKWIKSLHDRGFRSVVNLRAEDNSEASVVRNNGMTPKYIPVVDRAPPTMDQLEEFLDFATRRENQPVLVHCLAGKGRTGAFVAAYRIAVEGWRADDAYNESASKGMSSSRRELLREVERRVRAGTFPHYRAVR